MLTDPSTRAVTVAAAAAAAGCLLVGAALLLLLCLAWPRCPLRGAIGRRRQASSFGKSQRRNSNSSCNCCCCCFCFEEADDQVHPCVPPERKLDLMSDTVGPTSVAFQPQQQTMSHPNSKQQLLPAPLPEVALTFSLTRQSDCLAVHLRCAEGTPGPRLGLCHCNFAQARLLTLDGVIVESVRTGVVGKTASPDFNETLVLPLAEAAQVQLLLQCLDFDRFSRERVVGEALLQLPSKIGLPVQFDRLPLQTPLPESCEILVALHYVPAAEKLNVLVLKANDIRAADGTVPPTYLHLALLSGSSAVFKKRSRVFDPSPRPVYNESAALDLPRRRLDRVSLIVSVMSCHSAGRRVQQTDWDACLGFVVFSSSCYGSGRAHWNQMVARPKTALAYWHRLA